MWILLAFAHACDAPYTREAFAADIGAAQGGLREMDDANFGAAVRRVEAGLPCLNTVLTPGAYASTYRLVGAASWLLRDDATGAARWFRAAMELDPRYDWDISEIPLNHPMRRAWDTERPAANDVPEPVSGMALTPGAWTVDGRPVSQPAATAARPHLVQVVDADGAVRSWMIYGNAFPAEALGAPVPQVTEADLPATGFSAVSARRERPPAKTPLLLAGVGGVLAAGGAYGASFVTRGSFDAATTTESVQQAAGLTNGLVLGSGGLLLAGVVLGGLSFSL